LFAVASFTVDFGRVRDGLDLSAINPQLPIKPSIDPVAEYFAGALECPRKLLGISLRTRRPVSLDSTCKL
jgi:hypothetical protein